MRPSHTLKLVYETMPTVMSSGAVSPITRAMAIMIPVVIPAMAVRSTTLTMVRYFGTPSAYEASRSSFGEGA